MMRIGIVLLVGLLIGPIWGQWSPGPIVSGPSISSQFGYCVAFVGDVDGDGRDDFAVGAPLDFPNGPSSGNVRVYSGASGALIHSLNGLAAGDEFGNAIAGLGDVDGDGHADFVVGAHLADGYQGMDCGAFYQFDGLTGTMTWMEEGYGAGDEFGYSLACPGDLDGNGTADLLVGAPFNGDFGTWSGRVWIYGGGGGYPLLAGDADFERFGFSVAGAGDVDGDGHPDFVIGVPGDSASGIYAGSARVYSGFTGAVLHVFQGDSPFDAFGHSVASAGDANGDGRADLVVGAIKDDDAGSDSGSARILSGLDGAILHTFHGNMANAGFGYSVAGVGDADGDGHDDVVVGAPNDSTSAYACGNAQVLSGADGSIIANLAWASAMQIFGWSVAGGGDLNGDGFGDVLVGIPRAGALQEGRVAVYAAPTLPVLKYRTDRPLAHGLELDWFTLGSDPLGLIGTFEGSGATPGGLGLYVASLARIDYPAFGYLPLLVAIDPVNLLDSGGFGFDVMGELHSAPFSRQNPWLAGWNLHVQFFETSPVIASSPGIRLTMVP